MTGGVEERRVLGRTGVHVSPLCLGAMMFESWGNDDEAESIRIVHRALDAGINFIDTADVYSAGVSEEIVGKALKGRRDDVIVATKFFNKMGSDANMAGGSRRWIMRAVEASLRRLGTDWIDVFQMHRPDADTEIEETLGALTDLVHAGKIRYFGSSTFPAEALVEAHWAADRRGYQRFATEQPPYSILVRSAEAAVLPTARRYGMGVLTWSPLASGWLSGRYRAGRDLPETTRSKIMPRRFDVSIPGNERKLEVVEQLARLAEEAGLDLIPMAIAWVLNHPAVTSVIVGPRTIEHLESQLPAVGLRLPAELLDAIDELVPPGTDVNPEDATYRLPSLLPASRRR